MYIGLTLPETMITVSELFTEYPSLFEILDKKWVSEHLLFDTPRPVEDVHPLYWSLAHPDRNSKTAQNLLFFANSKPSGFSKLIEELKSEQGEENLLSTLNELETYCHLAQRGKSPEWQPLISSNSKKKMRREASIKPKRHIHRDSNCVRLTGY